MVSKQSPLFFAFRRSIQRSRAIQSRRRVEIEALEERCLLHSTGILADMPPVPALPPPLPGSFVAAANGMPMLHSFPAAPAALYLDFDGGVGYENTVYTPYDEDGDPNSFSSAEQASIYEAWRQVSAYFAMFKLDVTTVQPELTVPTAWVGIGNNIDNGFAYIGTFPTNFATGFVNSYFARTRQSGIAHEAGHIFGLEHQSTYDLSGNKTAEYAGATDPLHAPIMGIDYAGVAHKWFIGHPSDIYVGLPGSPGTLQDDMFIISGQIRRFDPAGDGYRADDFPDTIETATPLSQSNSGASKSGILERLSDIDAFSFVSAGATYNIAADRDIPSGAALKLEVYDSTRTLLAAKPGLTNDQQVTLTLAPGTYYLLVSTQGNYADMGAYNLSVRPARDGWDTQDIGFVAWPGHAAYDSAADRWSVGGAGSDIGGSSDNFRFVYQTLRGDGSITARVTAVENTSSSAKAGVMIRESLAANSRHAMMALRPAGAQFLRRTTTSGNTFTTSSSGQVAPLWVRLVRSGNSFFAYRSTDGVNWTFQGSSTITMGTVVHVGLAVTSRIDQQNGTVNDAGFSDVTVTGIVNPPPPGMLAPPTGLSLSRDAGAAVRLSWNSVIGATGYAIDRSIDNARWTQIASSNAADLTYVDTTAPGSNRYFYRVAALDAVGRSQSSASATIVNRPSAPSGVTLTNWNEMTILNWRDVSGETGYRIERSVDGSLWTVLGQVDPNVPSFTDPVPFLGNISSYRVIATGPIGDSAASNALSRLPTLVNLAPVITEPASASPGTVTGTTTALSVAAMDDGGEANLVYLWTTTAKPAGAPYPTFSQNNSSDAHHALATFYQAGNYAFTVTVTDTGGLTATSSVSVSVDQTLVRISISPSVAFVPLNGSQQFTAASFDQFGDAMNSQGGIAWDVTSGGGVVSSTGFYSAPDFVGTATVRASSGEVSDSATVHVVNSVPTVVTPASATPSPVTGTTATVSVLGDDDGGEANLTYTWEAVEVPSGAISPVFSPNGTNAAKNSTTRFFKAGMYTLLVSVRDGLGVSTTSSVRVAVNQTLTRVTVTPAAAGVVIGTTQQFSGLALDQFNFAIESQPNFVWAVQSGVGTIDTLGLYTAPSDAGRATVTASVGGVIGSAAVTVLLPAPSNLTATALAQGRVQLKWKDTCVIEDGFYVESSIDGVNWIRVATRGPSNGSGNNVTFVTDPFPSGRRFFRVQAFNANGFSGWSNVIDVML